MPSMPIMIAAMNRMMAIAIVSRLPITAISCPGWPSCLMNTVAYRLYAVTRVAAMVVMYMNSVGIAAYVGLRRLAASHTVTTSRLSDAINWFEAPNNCQMYTHVPVITRRNVAAMLISVPKWMLRKIGLRSPRPSASVTRMTRKTSWTTVMTITTNAANPMAVP